MCFMDTFVAILTACVPILVALTGTIPAIISNRKKTQETLEENRKGITAQITDVQTTLKEHIREDEHDNARNRRYRILRFYDEICEGRRHSESHFEDIMEDIDAYEAFCEAHPDFRNSRGKLAMKNIRETYDRLKREGKFLDHEREERNHDEH